jgi:GNAT superfamily N-acetyltransferase
VESARAATAADLDLIASLWSRAVAELDGQRGGMLLAGNLYRPDPQKALKSAFDDIDRFLVIGDIEGVPVGFASVYCDRDRREPVGVVEIVYVEPPARQVGVAESMIKLVMEWSAERGCVGVDAPALPGSRSAKAFFEDNGFVARLLVMHHPLDRESAGGDGAGGDD